MTTIKSKWRLSKLPTPSELVELVTAKVITQDEAKNILLEPITEEDVNVEALKKEIEFLRTVIDKLSSSRSETVKIIEKEIHHYKKYDWYQPYYTWTCNTAGYDTNLVGNGSITVSNGSTLLGTNGTHTTSSLLQSSLSSLKTF